MHRMAFKQPKLGRRHGTYQAAPFHTLSSFIFDRSSKVQLHRNETMLIREKERQSQRKSVSTTPHDERATSSSDTWLSVRQNGENRPQQLFKA